MDERELPDVVSARGLSSCLVDDCGKPLVARGRCRKHYQRWWTATPREDRPEAVGVRRLSPEERFRRKMDMRGPGECWLWRGSTTRGGHGEFFVSRERGKVPAHAFALELATGTACPPGFEGCHHCDNPPCVNPSHIYFGTHQQNVDDMRRRGRAAIGSARPTARLTESDVVELREAFAAGARLNDLAKRFGISDGRVSEIANGLAWKHVGGPITTRGHLGRPKSWSTP